ncbi:MAG TPA: NACHT domain-containing protein [Myxococcus sp.]|nr:NACHT domain-containing protein [Myxococcus sp.]
MPQKKKELLLSDYYGRLLVATHCAELIDAGEYRGPGPAQLRVEVEEHTFWDDLVEVRRGADSKQTVHGWQVKNQRTALDEETMRKQLKALAASSLDLGHLALHSLEGIKGLAPLNALERLCNRLRMPGLDLAIVLEGLTKAQQDWVEFGRKAAGLASDEDCLCLFQRLEVIQLGTQERLQNQALKDLRRWYAEPEQVFERLLAFLAKHPDEAVVIDYPLLRDSVLQGHTPSLRRGQSFLELRERYLQELVRSHGQLGPLKSLGTEDTSDGPPLRMVDVFVPPVLRQMKSGRLGVDPDLEEIPSQERAMVPRSEPRWSRLRNQARAMSLQRSTIDLAESLLKPSSLPSRIILVEGPVGAGKSMLLEHLRQVLAREGLRNAGAPLPILLDARDLVERTLEHAFQRKLRFRGGEALLDEDGQKRIFLVDGLDEVASRDVWTASQVLDQLSRDRDTAALVLASRPAAFSMSLPETPLRLRIAPWTERDIEQFLEKWRQYRPGQVTSLGESWRKEPMRSALANPLTATFCLLLAHERPQVRSSRTALFGGIVAKLFQEWANTRGPANGGARVPRWHEVSEPLQQLALESLRSGRETLAAQDIRELLRGIDPDRDSEWMDAASLHLGLLVRQSKDEYRFVLRGITEYLAGMALHQQGVKHLLQEVPRRWAEEPVRHAIGIASERKGSEAALALLRQLLPSKIPSGVLEALSQLRATLVVARAAQDLGLKARPIADALAKPVVMFLRNPVSTWMPERISELVRDMAHVGGPCWEAVHTALREASKVRGSLAKWFASRTSEDWRWWVGALSVSDGDARIVMTHRLGRWVDVQEVRQALFLQLFDGHRVFMGAISAPVFAGMALRHATRDELFVNEVRPKLIDLLDLQDQQASGGAALALLPGEVEPERMISALRELASAYDCPREVIEALAAVPEGQAALQSLWPEWSSLPQVRPFEPPVHPNLPPEAPPPLASSLVPVVRRAMGPALAHMQLEELLETGLLDGREFVDTFCEEALDHPEGILQVLRTASSTTHFNLNSQLALREAAVRHPQLARELLDLWERWKSTELRSRFPGLALDSLVAAGMEEAARAFALWLEHTYFFSLPTAPLPLSVATLRHPFVKPAAHARAWKAWREHTEQGVSIRTSATALASLRTAWEDDAELQETLRQRAVGGDDEALHGMLRIYEEPAAPLWLNELLVARLESLINNEEFLSLYTLGNWLGHVERESLEARLQPQLEILTRRYRWERYSAACLLFKVSSPDEVRTLSERMAVEWPAAWALSMNSEAELTRLVSVHPQAWYERLQRILRDDPVGMLLVRCPLFELVRALLPRLSRNEQRALLQQVGNSMGLLHHPWVATDGFRNHPRRPADFFQELLFDSDAL